MLLFSRIYRSKELSQPKIVTVSTATKPVVVIKQCILLRAVFVFHASSREHKHKAATEVWFSTIEKMYFCEEMFQT
jgi:hypothetical protein